MAYSKQTIKELYRSLPDELKSIVATQEISSINDDIAKAYGLNTKQRLELGDEITMRLIGVTTGKNFASNLETRLGITPEITKKLEMEIENKIFSKIPNNILSSQEEYAQSKLKESSAYTTVNIPKIAPEMHPMVEKGEIAHDVPLPEERGEHTEPKEAPAPANLPTEELRSAPSIPAPEVRSITPPSPEPKQEEKAPEPPKSSYAPGQDPYREPIE
jgi:hypothetical protein